MTDYEKGYLDGLNANIKSLKPQEGEIIFLGLPCEYLNYDVAKHHMMHYAIYFPKLL